MFYDQKIFCACAKNSVVGILWLKFWQANTQFTMSGFTLFHRFLKFLSSPAIFDWFYVSLSRTGMANTCWKRTKYSILAPIMVWNLQCTFRHLVSRAQYIPDSDKKMLAKMQNGLVSGKTSPLANGAKPSNRCTSKFSHTQHFTWNRRSWPSQPKKEMHLLIIFLLFCLFFFFFFFADWSWYEYSLETLLHKQGSPSTARRHLDMYHLDMYCWMDVSYTVDDFGKQNLFARILVHVHMYMVFVSEEHKELILPHWGSLYLWRYIWKGIQHCVLSSKIR